MCLVALPRYQIKKSVMDVKTRVMLPDHEHQTIYELTKSIVEGTKCAITPALCSRIALMVRISGGFHMFSDSHLP